MTDRQARRILVVEDEEMVREIVSWALEDLGFHVCGAESGDEALAMLADGGIDLLLTDIRMPGGIDGWTLAEKARAAHPGLPVIYVSGFSDEPPRQISGSFFLQKPLGTEKLREALEKMGMI